MQARTRQAFNTAGCRVTDIITPHFGFPSPIVFGSAGDIGDSEVKLESGLVVPTSSRADHVHAMPDYDVLFDTFRDVTHITTDFVHSGSAPNGLVNYADGTSGTSFDRAGVQGQYGSEMRGTGGGAPPRRAGSLFVNGTVVAGDETVGARHLLGRLAHFEARGRMVEQGSNEPEQYLPNEPRGTTIIVGAFRTGTGRDLSTITDGLFFRWRNLNTPGGLQEPWHAVAYIGGSVVLDDPLDVEPSFDFLGGTHPYAMKNQTMVIEYTGGNLAFFSIDGITGINFGFHRVPRSLANVSVAGFGVALETNVNAPTLTVSGWAMDYAFVKGRRVVI